jgi:hypothetical protein
MAAMLVAHVTPCARMLASVIGGPQQRVGGMLERLAKKKPRGCGAKAMEISRAAVAARNCNTDMLEAAGQAGPSHVCFRKILRGEVWKLAAGHLQDSLVATLSRSQIGEQERTRPAGGVEFEVQ